METILRCSSLCDIKHGHELIIQNFGHMHDMDPYVYVRENKKKHISTLKTNVWVEDELNSAPVKDAQRNISFIANHVFPCWSMSGCD